MDENNRRALVVAFFLSKFDRAAIESLGYKSWNDAYAGIGDSLAVKPSTVKNMRDDFDPYHPNDRAGWYQREPRPSRAALLEKYSSLSFDAMKAIVLSVLDDSVETEPTRELVLKTIEADPSDSDDHSEQTAKGYVPLGPTGRAAEELFERMFRSGAFTFSGHLTDCRDFGCGYDYAVEATSGQKLAVEVKGLRANKGGIRLTDKEWDVAKELAENYFLVIFRDLNDKPTVQIIQNPVEKLNATSYTTTVVSVSWSVSDSELLGSSDPAVVHL